MIFLSSYCSTNQVNTIEKLIIKPSTNWTIRYFIFSIMQAFPIACVILSFIFFAAKKKILGETFTIPTQISLYSTAFISIITLLAYLSLTTTSALNILKPYIQYEKYYKLGLIGIYTLLLVFSYFSVKIKLSLINIKTIKENLIFIAIIYNIFATFGFVVYDNIQYNFDNMLQYNVNDVLNLYQNNTNQLKDNYNNALSLVNSAITTNTDSLNNQFNSLTYDVGSILFNNGTNITNQNNTLFASAIQNYYNSIIKALGLDTNLNVTSANSPIMQAVFSYVEQDHKTCGTITKEIIKNINNNPNSSIQNCLQQILINDLTDTTNSKLAPLVSQNVINLLPSSNQINTLVNTAMQNSIIKNGAIDLDLQDPNSSLSQGLSMLITTKLTSDPGLTLNFLNYLLSQIDPNTKVLTPSTLSSFNQYLNDDLIGLFDFCANNNVFSASLDPLISDIIANNNTVQQSIINLFKTKSATSLIDQSLPSNSLSKKTIQALSDTIQNSVDLKINVDLIILSLLDQNAASSATPTSNFDNLIQKALDNVFFNAFKNESGISTSTDFGSGILQYIEQQLNLAPDSNNCTFLQHLLYGVNQNISTSATVANSNMSSFSTNLGQLVADTYANDPTVSAKIDTLVSNLYSEVESMNVYSYIYDTFFDNFFTKVNYCRQLTTASTLPLITKGQSSLPNDLTSTISLFFDYFIITGGLLTTNYSITFQSNISPNINGLSIFFPELNANFIFNCSSNYFKTSYTTSGSTNTLIPYANSTYAFIKNLNLNNYAITKVGDIEIAAVRVNNFLTHDILMIGGNNFYIMFLPNGQFLCIRDVGTVVSNRYGIYDVLTNSDVNGYPYTPGSGTQNIYEYTSGAEILPSSLYTQNQNIDYFIKNKTIDQIDTTNGLNIYLSNDKSTYINISSKTIYSNCVVLSFYEKTAKILTVIFDYNYYSIISVSS